MICASCGTENRAGSKFCDNCGASLAATCPHCGEPNRADARFCASCGLAIGADASRLATAGAVSETGQPSATAERRLVSVMFTDLVGFSSLSGITLPT